MIAAVHPYAGTCLSDYRPVPPGAITPLVVIPPANAPQDPPPTVSAPLSSILVPAQGPATKSSIPVDSSPTSALTLESGSIPYAGSPTSVFPPDTGSPVPALPPVTPNSGTSPYSDGSPASPSSGATTGPVNATPTSGIRTPSKGPPVNATPVNVTGPDSIIDGESVSLPICTTSFLYLRLRKLLGQNIRTLTIRSSRIVALDSELKALLVNSVYLL